MMPNIDPRTMKSMMAKMGIKSSDVNAIRVVIECGDMDIIVEQPQVTRMEVQGTTSFQIVGNVSERAKAVSIEASEDDIKMVMEKTGITDREKVEKAIKEANGDIAEAIVSLTG